MRILFVVGLIVLLFGVLYRALRPVLRTALQFIRAVRHFKEATNTTPRSQGTAEKLVQCATCGTWIPQSRSLSANSMDYCSRECVKRGGVLRRNSAA